MKPSEISKLELARLYHSQQLSYAGIARRLGCSRAYVSKLMSKHGISPRSRSLARIVAIKCKRLPGHVLAGTREYDAKRREYSKRGAVAAQRRYRKRHPERARAHWRVQKAVARGTLVRSSTCQHCNVQCKPHGHHKDYSKPLEVVWLCRECHRAEHRGQGRARSC